MNQFNKHKYDTNFTAGGLLLGEFQALEKIISGNEIEGELKAEETLNHYIGIKTVAARIRILREIKRRVNSTQKEFWNQFYLWSETEQKLGLFYVCLETYKIVFDIHWEVTIMKFKTGNNLDDYSIAMFLDEIASKDEEVASWSSSTLEKIKTRYLRALNHAGLLNDECLHKPQGISEAFWTFFKAHNLNWFLEACFIA